jgi:hypothetical protein
VIDAVPTRPSTDDPVADTTEPRLAHRYALFIPAVLVLVPIAISFVAWSFPPHRSGLTGFIDRAVVSWPGLLLVGSWAACVVLVATIAFGASLSRGPIQALTNVRTGEFHVAALVLGTIGTASIYWSVTGGNLGTLVTIWSGQDFDNISYEFEYGAGISTGRYGAVLAGGFTIAHLLRGRPLRTIDAASILLVVATTFLNARITVAMAIVVALSILAFSGERPRLPRTAIILSAVAVSTIMVVANYSRNGDIYKERGVESPIEMTLVNAQAYLATPTQFTVGVSDALMDGRARPSGSAEMALAPILPPTIVKTFGGPEPLDVGTTVFSRYQGVIGYSLEYTTNGAAIDLLMVYGWWAWPGALLMAAAMIWVAGRFAVSGEIGAAVAGAVLYGLVEIWRVWILNAGSMNFILVMGFGAVAVGALRGRTARTRMRPAATGRG